MIIKILKLFFFAISLFVNVTLAIWTFYIGRSPYERLIQEIPNDFSKIEFVTIQSLWQLFFFEYHRNIPTLEFVNNIASRANLIKIKLKAKDYTSPILLHNPLFGTSMAFLFQIHNKKTKQEQDFLTFLNDCKMQELEKRVRAYFWSSSFCVLFDHPVMLLKTYGITEVKKNYKRKVVECQMRTDEQMPDSYKVFYF